MPVTSRTVSRQFPAGPRPSPAAGRPGPAVAAGPPACGGGVGRTPTITASIGRNVAVGVVVLLLLLMLLAAPPAGASSRFDAWQAIGPDGANVLAVAVDPTDADRQVAGGFAGLFRTADGGAQWVRADAELPVSDVGSVLFGADGTLWAGTFGAGVHRSTDGGATFTAANTGIESATVFTLLEADGRLWAGTASDGLFVSTDGGSSWESRSNGLADQQVNDLLRLGPDELLVATKALTGGAQIGIFRSTDSGSSWSPSSTGLGNWNVDALAGAPGDTVLYAGTLHSVEIGGVYRSTDSGATWEPTVFGLTNRNIADLLVDGSNSATLYAATQPLAGFTQSGIYRSTDAGASWAIVYGGAVLSDVRALAQRPDDGSLLAALVGQTAPGSGVVTSGDGTTWERRSRGLTVMRCDALATRTTGAPEILLGTTGDFRVPRGAYRSTDAGASWESFTAGGLSQAIACLAISPLDGERRYAGTITGLYRWDTNASAWRATTLTMGINDLLVVTTSGSEVIWAATQTGLFRSNDLGETWESRSTSLGTVRLTAVAVDTTNPGVIYAGSDTGGVYATTDAGEVWETANTNLGSFDIRDLVFDERGTLLAATAAGIFEYDAGSWLDHSDGLTELDVRGITIYRGERFAATAAGVFRSSTTEQVTPWEAVNDGLSNLDVLIVHADRSGDVLRLFAGTNGGGVFEAQEVLPVAIASFAASGEPGRVELVFRTAFERDHLGFRVERRLAGEEHFEARTRELLRGGPTYRFVDLDPRLAGGSRVDYRLLAVARDGGVEVHGPYAVEIATAGAPAAPPAGLRAAPTPFGRSTTLHAPNGAGILRIVDVSGRELRRITWPAGARSWSWDGRDAAGREVPSGVYWIELRGTGGSRSTRVVRIAPR
jgi:hypothetical protein